jgi:hypothetical protein
LLLCYCSRPRNDLEKLEDSWKSWRWKTGFLGYLGEVLGYFRAFRDLFRVFLYIFFYIETKIVQKLMKKLLLKVSFVFLLSRISYIFWLFGFSLKYCSNHPNDLSPVNIKKSLHLVEIIKKLKLIFFFFFRYSCVMSFNYFANEIILNCSWKR